MPWNESAFVAPPSHLAIDVPQDCIAVHMDAALKERIRAHGARTGEPMAEVMRRAVLALLAAEEAV